MKVKILGCEVKRSGISQKNGKPWTIYGVSVEGKKFPVDCFDDMSKSIGQEVEGDIITKTYEKKDGTQGTNYELKLAKMNRAFGGGKDWSIEIKSLSDRISVLEKSNPNTMPNTTPPPQFDDSIPF